MSDEELKARIVDLENELSARHEDLKNYRSELKLANQKLEQLISNVSRDIKVLTRIQKSLVPTELPHIQGFEFSTKFIPSAISGGDYLDIFEHRDQLKFSLVMSSASGYGMSALLLSSLISLSSVVDEDESGEARSVLKTVLTEILPMASPEDRAEMFYAMIDRRTLDMQYCALGDVYAFYLPRSGKMRAIEGALNPISKSMDISDVISEVISLSSKDRVVICSRGIVEAQNLQEEIFSTERLIKTLLSLKSKEVHDVRNEILFQVQQFCQGAQPVRDQSVIVLEVKDSVLKLAT